MTLKQYEEEYVVDAIKANTTGVSGCTIIENDHKVEKEEDGEEPLLPPDSLECVLDVKTEPGLEVETEEAQPKPIKLESRDRPGPLSAVRRAALAAAALSSLAPDTSDKAASNPRMVWVPWFESKLTSCLICSETRTCGLSFKNHLYDRHKYMSRKEYMRRFPDADIEPSQWSCPVCRNTVKWTKKCIVDHLRVAHSLTH